MKTILSNNTNNDNDKFANRVGNATIVLVLLLSVTMTVHLLVARPTEAVSAEYASPASQVVERVVVNQFTHLHPSDIETCTNTHQDTQNIIFEYVMGDFYSYETNHWFHIAEHITSIHAQAHESVYHSARKNAPDVYLVFDNEEYFANLSPMTRLLATLGLASVNTQRVHFVLGKVFADSIQRIAVVRIQDAFVVDLNTQAPLDRFMTSAMKAADHPELVCGSWVGEVGHNRISRDAWFRSPSSLNTFRSLIAHTCFETSPDTQQSSSTTTSNESSSPEATSTPHQVLIYQRDLSRRLLEGEELQSEIRAIIDSQGLSHVLSPTILMHSNSASPCHLAQVLSRVRIFISPHGFQHMLTLFLPSHALIYEIFPARYFKLGYKLLANGMDIRHDYETSTFTNAPTNCTAVAKTVSERTSCRRMNKVMNVANKMRNWLLGFIPTLTCKQMYWCRFVARSSDVTWSEDTVQRISEEVAWQGAYLASQEAGGAQEGAQ